MTTERPALERYGFVALTGCLSLIQLNIITGEGVFGTLAAILWIVVAVQDARRPLTPPFFVPLLALAGWTFVSTIVSPDRLASLREDKQLLLYLIVPATMRLARGPRATTAVNAMIAVGSLGAFIGIVQALVTEPNELLHARPHGLLGHYMTYSGILMLIACAATAQLVYRGRDWVWPAVAVPALLIALAMSQTRNAWLGGIAGMGLVLMLRRRAWLVAVPVVIAIALTVPAVRSRALSVFDPTNTTNLDRVSMLKSGVAMIKDHPLFGVGPNMVPREYLEHYKRADAKDPADQPGSTRAHLHDVPVQLAAERGLPALACWIWFLVVAWRDLWRQLRRGVAPALAATGLAAILAMVVAGLFEHNFGDSEFLIVLLGLVTLPFAAALSPDEAPAPVPAGAGTRRPSPALGARAQ